MVLALPKKVMRENKLFYKHIFFFCKVSEISGECFGWQLLAVRTNIGAPHFKAFTLRKSSKWQRRCGVTSTGGIMLDDQNDLLRWGTPT